MPYQNTRLSGMTPPRLSAGIAELDPTGRFIHADERYCEMLGYSSVELCGMQIQDVTYSADRPRSAELLSQLIQGGTQFQSEARYRRKDGALLWIASNAESVRDCDGRAIKIVSVSIDVTQYKQAAATLRRQTQRFETLNRIAKILSSDLDLERIVQAVTDSATQLSGAKFGAFFYNMTDTQGERYMLYTLSGASRAAFEKFGLPRNSPLFEPTFRGMRIVRCADVRTDPLYGKNAPHHGMPEGHLPVVSYLAVPVISRTGEVHGGLFFGHDQPGVFDQEAEDIVAGIAPHAAIAIDNAKLLRVAQDTQRQSQRLASLVESSDDAIIATDLDGTITHWNPGAQRLLGYTSEEMLHQPVTTLLPPNLRTEETRTLERIRRGERIEHYETVRRHKDGTLIHLSLTQSPILDSAGNLVGASKVARDITERKLAQEKQALLLTEMSHRIKNMLAITNGLLALSAKTARNPAELAESVRDRLVALARAHELIHPDHARSMASQPSTTLKALLCTILAPFVDMTSPDCVRASLRGPEISMAENTATSFALVFHELATNAAKYGAFSCVEGCVEIDWSLDSDGLVLNWTERGGPAVDGPPSYEGFGSRLAGGSIESLGGQLVRYWDRAGLRIRCTAQRQLFDT